TNKYSNPVDTIAASLTFTAGANQTWVHTASMPTNVLPEDSATVSFSITVDQNSGNLNSPTIVNGYLEASDGLATLTNSTALITSRYTIRKKAELIISSVDTTFEKVNKGQGGIPVQMTISNGSPQVPLVLQTASLTFSLGQYTLSPEFVFDPADQGLFGSYFYTTTVNPPPFPTQASATRLDSAVNFNWGTASPIPGVISADYFAVRWSGYVIPEFSEDYTFYFWADDGVRVWVNGQMIINSWVTSAFERTSVSVPLTAGVPAEIVIDYYERASNARAELSWSAPSQTKQIIPAGRLKPAYLPVIHGGQSITLNYTVAVQPTSPSGVAYIKGIASGTNAWVPGLVTDSNSPLVFDSWIIQSPASLSIGLIKVPPVVYRGQANIPVEVEIINTGEADAQIASIPLFISLGDYENIIPGQTMPVTITGGQSKFIKVLVSVLENTATGSAIIDAEVSGTDVNNGSSLSAAGAAVPGEWTVLAEKILSYKDPSYLYPSNAFSRPDSGETFIYALAENLVPLKEYGIRWYDASGSEIISATTIGFSDNTGKLAGEWSITSATDFGVYTVKITNPVNTYSPSQTNFRVVTSASVSATLELPQKVSVGQAFQGRMVITNIGGAEAAGMVPDPLTIAGPGTANLTSGP
ncbi:MAG TPA: PA14 domain-containing protein, partial [Candidatus Rifleibacterium sp.]|nr:PA14 domain-containing protein [Candidatus Rifleibacterium sp.]